MIYEDDKQDDNGPVETTSAKPKTCYPDLIHAQFSVLGSSMMMGEPSALAEDNL